jgi:hypothetical protein
MFLQHVWGLLAHPAREWQAIHDERCTIGTCYCSHVLMLSAIPAVCGYIGTTQVGWQIGSHEVTTLTPQSALPIAVLFYITMLVGVFTVGKLMQWMGKTYGADKPLPQCIALSAYTATPLFLIGFAVLYPVLWLDMLLGLPALAYSVYLLYTGVPIMMEIPPERGFLFSTAVLGVGLVMLVGVMAASAILWSWGIGPVFTGG